MNGLFLVPFPPVITTLDFKFIAGRIPEVLLKATVLEYLPPVVNSTEYELDEETRKKREEIEKEWNEMLNNK